MRCSLAGRAVVDGSDLPIGAHPQDARLSCLSMPPRIVGIEHVRSVDRFNVAWIGGRETRALHALRHELAEVPQLTTLLNLVLKLVLGLPEHHVVE